MTRTELDLNRLVTAIVGGQLPPWRPVPSRQLASLLGVSLQVLANWRVRDIGPPPSARRRGAGHRTFYRLDEVAVWASGDKVSSWEISRDWLAMRGLEVVGESSEASTVWLIESADAFVR